MTPKEKTSDYPLKRVVGIKKVTTSWTLYTLECGHTVAGRSAASPKHKRCYNCFRDPLHF